MRLRQKTGWVVLTASLVLVGILLVTSTLLFRQYTIDGATRYARTVAEMVRTALTESMLNGTTATLDRLLTRLADTEGLSVIRVIRSPQVVEQFGPGGQATRPKAAADELDEEVLKSGQPRYLLLTEGPHPVFRATIPYIADSRGDPNCLSCHTVSEGTVLGVVTIMLSVADILAQAQRALALLAVTILLFAPMLVYVLWRLYQPVVDAAEGVERAVARAGEGDFSIRVQARGSDEAGRIATQMNQLMELLQSGLTQIADQISKLIHYERRDDVDLLSETIRVVDELVDGAQFKQAIEEDETKSEVYARLSEVMRDKFALEHFSIYEVDDAKHRMVPVVVDGEASSSNRWCDAQILVRAEACRARRTGHPVDSFRQHGICTMFAGGAQDDAPLEHVCLPVLQSGGVGSVVQVVAPPDNASRVKDIVPYLAIHLREAAPVLEAKRLMDTLRESTLRDAMTGLYNRRFLEEYIETLVATTLRNSAHLGLLMLDLDYFKKVNDTFGHEVGDKVLIELARVIRQNVRASDLTIRFGGEEFLVILQNTEAEGAMVLAEKVRAAVEAMRVQVTGTTVKKTISIGVADFPGDGDSFWQVVKFADVALYAAKDAGRNQVTRFVPDMWGGAEGEY